MGTDLFLGFVGMFMLWAGITNIGRSGGPYVARVVGPIFLLTGGILLLLSAVASHYVAAASSIQKAAIFVISLVVASVTVVLIRTAASRSKR